MDALFNGVERAKKETETEEVGKTDRMIGKEREKKNGKEKRGRKKREDKERETHTHTE